MRPKDIKSDVEEHSQIEDLKRLKELYSDDYNYDYIPDDKKLPLVMFAHEKISAKGQLHLKLKKALAYLFKDFNFTTKDRINFDFLSILVENEDLDLSSIFIRFLEQRIIKYIIYISLKYSYIYEEGIFGSHEYGLFEGQISTHQKISFLLHLGVLINHTGYYKDSWIKPMNIILNNILQEKELNEAGIGLAFNQIFLVLDEKNIPTNSDFFSFIREKAIYYSHLNIHIINFIEPRFLSDEDTNAPVIFSKNKSSAQHNNLPIALAIDQDGPYDMEEESSEDYSCSLM